MMFGLAALYFFAKLFQRLRHPPTAIAKPFSVSPLVLSSVFSVLYTTIPFVKSQWVEAAILILVCFMIWNRSRVRIFSWLGRIAILWFGHCVWRCQRLVSSWWCAYVGLIVDQVKYARVFEKACCRLSARVRCGRFQPSRLIHTAHCARGATPTPTLRQRQRFWWHSVSTVMRRTPAWQECRRDSNKLKRKLFFVSTFKIIKRTLLGGLEINEMMSVSKERCAIMELKLGSWSHE